MAQHFVSLDDIVSSRLVQKAQGPTDTEVKVVLASGEDFGPKTLVSKNRRENHVAF